MKFDEVYTRIMLENAEQPTTVSDLVQNQKETMLAWSGESKSWAAVSIESGEPKGYYADVTDIGDGMLAASVFDCINIARDEARANGEDFDEEADTEQHLADFIEDYSPTTYTPDVEDAEESEDTVDVTLPKELAEVLHELLMGITSDEDSDLPEEDAEYQGRKVTLNKPTRGDVKKFKVYVKDPKTGNVKKVNFGHGGTSAKRKTMRIRKSNPGARKSFRARHKCDQKKSKLTAGYWSCKKW